MLPEDFPLDHNSLTLQAVDEFKHTAMYLQKPEVFWHSEDTVVGYIAYPLNQEQEAGDITQLAQRPGFEVTDSYNTWLMVRLGPSDEEDSFDIDLFYFNFGQPIRKTSVTLELESDKLDEALEDYRRIAEAAKNWDGLPLIDNDSYVDALQAIIDLEPFRLQAMDDYTERRRGMTQAEKRQERAQKFSWLINPEVNKAKRNQWWLLDTYTGAIFMVRANSPDLAAAIVDEHFEEKVGRGLPLPMCSVEPCEDEYTAQFEQEFGDAQQEVIRLIPFSRVPWPDDMERVTAEQQAAFDKLKASDHKDES